MIPKVTIEDNTLCYHQSFQGCVIQIVNDDNDIVYTNILPENNSVSIIFYKLKKYRIKN